MSVRDYLIEDIKHLSDHDVNKLYKYVRRYLVANIEGLVDPLETKYNSSLTKLKQFHELISEQKYLDPEIQQVLNDNFWDLL